VHLREPFVGAVARAMLDADRADALFTTVSRSLETSGNTTDRAFAEACFLAGRDDPVAAAAMAEAAERAGEVNDYPTAIRLARAAWERGEHPSGVVTLITCLPREGAVEESLQLATAALERPALTGEPVAAAQIASYLGFAHYWLNRPHEALAVFEREAERLRSVDCDHLLRADQARVLMFSGQVARARVVAEEVAAASPEGKAGAALNDTTVGAADGSTTLAQLDLLAGRPDDAHRHATRSFELLLTQPDLSSPFNLGESYLLGVFARAAGGDLAGATEALAAVEVMISSLDSSYAIGFSRLLFGRVATWCGDDAAAGDHLAEAAHALVDADRPGFARLALAGLAGSRSRCGRGSEACAALAELDRLPPSALRYSEPNIDRERAWVASALGDQKRAMSRLADAAEVARELDDQLDLAEVLLDQARMGDLAGVAELKRIAAAAQGRLIPAWATAVDALHGADPSRLAAAAADLEAVGASLLAAEWWSAASRAERDDARRAHASARARALAPTGVRTPLLDAGGVRVELSAREHELAELAASGLSRTQIAERLGVSARTVDSHLQRVCRKLGVRRRDLAAALTSLPAR
jgi:DNA-binding CsgD family transcriptional regulator